jgi:hypothetical protein
MQVLVSVPSTQYDVVSATKEKTRDEHMTTWNSKIEDFLYIWISGVWKKNLRSFRSI